MEEKHGSRVRRDWRKLHLAVDADNFSIVAHTLTVSQTDGTIAQVTAVVEETTGPPCQRDRHLGMIQEKGGWPGRMP